jgi:hypothetical protein
MLMGHVAVRVKLARDEINPARSVNFKLGAFPLTVLLHSL